MTLDLSKKRIILIHGLASKPPERACTDLWRRCLIENIRMYDKPLAAALEENVQVFVSAYWANATPHHIEDDNYYVRRLKTQVEKVIDERRNVKEKFHVGAGEKIGAFFKDRGLDVTKLLAGALTVKDEVMKQFLEETRLYDEDQYVADRMRAPLQKALMDAWDSECVVAILSHSMGTFISYDVLWRFSHRSTQPFAKYRNKRVQMFVTMGSPLGDQTVRELLFSARHKEHDKRSFPTNIDFWHNYACLGDVVSHRRNFDKEFYDPMRELGLLPERPKYRGIDYVNLHNPFRVVSHKGNKDREKGNPHKSYGYLVQPRLGSWIKDFLRGDLRY